MKVLWNIFKTLLSIFMLGVAAFLLYAEYRKPGGLMVLVFVLVLFTSILWIDYTKPTRAGAVLAFLFGIGLCLLAYRILGGDAPFPKNCSTSRGTLLCNLDNALYSVGGRPAASIPSLVGAFFIFRLALKIFQRSRAIKN
jgi:hypothetical protein